MATMTLQALWDSKPYWAKAMFVAEFEEDRSELMTDYFATATTKRIFLGWSKHTRDLFPEMRKAAAKFSETASLAEMGEAAERREKYAWGAGYYLKASGRYSTGWKVRKLKSVSYMGALAVEFMEPTTMAVALPSGDALTA